MALPSQLSLPIRDNRKIWVLGSSNHDTTHFVDSLPRPGETINASSVLQATGGKGANQAAAASCCGALVSFVGAIGDDHAGPMLHDALRQAGIDTSFLQVIGNCPSGSALVLVENSGQNSIVTFPGANSRIDTGAIPRLPIGAGDLALAQMETTIEATHSFLSHAKARGAFTILNPSPLQPLPPSLLREVELIVANQSELWGLTGQGLAEHDAVIRLHRKGPAQVVITLGSRGTLLYRNGRCTEQPGYQVTPVDTQGAGDAFLGVLCATLARGNTLEDAARFANAVAAFSVTCRGSTQRSLPRFKESPTTLTAVLNRQ